MYCFKHFILITTLILALTVFPAACESYAWDCPGCGRTGNTGNYCGSCAHPAPWIENNAAATDIPKAVKVGDYITFGHYPQTAEGNDNTPIEWLVLNVQGDKALLISRYGLDCQRYHNTYTSITWESCSLRAWLNSNFVNNAFSTAEQKIIKTTVLSNGPVQDRGWNASGGNDTQDKVFLLSYTQAQDLLDYKQGQDLSTYKGMHKCIPTNYAVSHGARTDNRYGGGEYCYWWLRSPGFDQKKASYIRPGGGSITSELGSIDITYDKYTVRPALWIDLNSELYLWRSSNETF